MPYPKNYVGQYGNLARYLSQNGFKVYPMEMISRPVINNRHYIVDVVAITENREIWAFEYKSFNDPVKKAVWQAQNYLFCFDQVVVVAENLKDLTKHRPKFRKLGIGTWHINGCQIMKLDEAKLQPPTIIPYENRWNKTTWKDVMLDRFLRNTGLKKQEKIMPKSQQSIVQFLK